MIGNPHILSYDEAQKGIQWLALLLLGDSSQCPTLVQASNLSPPYVTTDASQVYGPPVVDTSFATALSAGADTISCAGCAIEHQTVYLTGVTANGVVAESAAVASYNGSTITLGAPLQNSYPAGLRPQLFSEYVVDYNVLLPGDVLFVPVESASLALTSGQQLARVFGSDIADPVSFAGGDIATVSGLATLNQRLRVFIQTTLGNLSLHPDFGSRIMDFIGQPSQSVRWSAILNQAMPSLPEVQSVQNTSVIVDVDTVYVTATVIADTTVDAIELVNEAFNITP